MNEPLTEAGRGLFHDDPLIPGKWRPTDLLKRIAAIEAEAVAAYLASPEAEQALAVALRGYGRYLPTSPEPMSYNDVSIVTARAVLAAWTEDGAK